MTPRTFIHLPCAFYTPETRRNSYLQAIRDNEFQEGFKSFFEVLSPLMNSNWKVQVFDNTVLPGEEVPLMVQGEIPSWCPVVLAPGANRFGMVNKGAGTMEGWHHSQGEILLTDWFIHHEPRTLIQDPRFLIDCLTLGPTRFADRGDHFYTGTLAMRSYHVGRFLETTDIHDMVSRGIGIEYNLREFVEGIVPEKKLHLYPDAGILWSDSSTGTKVRM